MLNSSKTKYNVLVLDMQPIDPPVGGGRLRLLGLYHDLGEDITTTYIGSYDWPGPGYRRHKISPTLEEINIPLSEQHFLVKDKWEVYANNKIIIDTTFSILGRISENYVKTVKKYIPDSDIVIFSHPWVYPLVRDKLDYDKQIVVYDAHNVEGLLRTELLDDGGFGSDIAKSVVINEYELSHNADVILVCSKLDMVGFKTFYDINSSKMIEIPNGVFTESIVPPNEEQKKYAKEKLRVNGTAAIFMGSDYLPNVEAAEFICKDIAPNHSDVQFIICGSVSDSPRVKNFEKFGPENITLTSFVTEDEKKMYLWASDFALNPMVKGSGTNIKMFDFMAAGLPVISTSAGARGIECGGLDAIKVVTLHEFNRVIQEIHNSPDRCLQMNRNCRKIVEEKYAYEIISKNLGCKLKAWHKRKIPRCENKKESCFFKSEGISSPKTAVDITEQVHTTITGEPKLSILTTWDVKCGIAEYSSYLVDALTEKGIYCYILADKGNNSKISDKKGWIDSHTYVEEVWDHLQNGDFNINRILQSLSGINNLSIQYHQEFFNEKKIVELSAACIAHSINVSVTLHNIIEMEQRSIKALDEIGAKLIIHKKSDVSALSQRGINNAVWIPMGVLDIEFGDELTELERHSQTLHPVIGTFGFLRPHKGLKELISAIDLLKDLYPSISLMAFCSLYPSDDSHAYLLNCQEAINNYNLNNHVKINSDFMKIQKIIEQLHQCDLIVLPYKHSNEGASASANTALAAKRPLITTKLEIFEDLRKITYQVENNHYASLALSIANVLSYPYLMNTLRSKAIGYVAKNSWEKFARKYFAEIYK